MNQLNLNGEDVAGNDEFFGALRSRNLNEIFFEEKFDENNETLKYQPEKEPSIKKSDAASSIPKKPTAKVNSSSSPAKLWNTQIAKIVNVFKNNESFGKIGAAIIKNDEDIKMILYKTKVNILCSINLKLYVENLYFRKVNNYYQFYDTAGLYWSFIFLNETDENEFVAKLKECNVRIKDEKETAEKQQKSHEKLQVEKENALRISDEEVKKHTKTALVARMAKIGKTLPKVQNTTDDDSCSSEGKESETELLGSSKFRNIKKHSKSVCSTLTPLDSQFVQLMVAENRTQTAELRMSMMKLENTVEKIKDKVELLNTSSDPKRDRDDEIIELEEKILALKKDNRKLKQIVAKGQNTEDTQEKSNNENIIDTIYITYKSTFEELNIPATDNPISLIKILLDKIQLTESLAKEKSESKTDEAIDQLKDCEAKLEIEKENYLRCQNKLKEFEKTIKELETSMEAVKVLNCELQTTVDSQMKLNKKASIEAIDVTTDAVKDIMNTLFTELTTKIENIEIKKETVLAVIARTIREETVKAIEQLKQ